METMQTTSVRVKHYATITIFMMTKEEYRPMQILYDRYNYFYYCTVAIYEIDTNVCASIFLCVHADH